VVSLVRRTKLERREVTYVVLSRPTTDLGPPAWTLVGIRLSRAFRRPTLLRSPSHCLPFRRRQQTLQVFDNSQTRWWQSDAPSPVDFGPNRTRNAGISPIPRELPGFRFVPAAAAFVRAHAWHTPPPEMLGSGEPGTSRGDIVKRLKCTVLAGLILGAVAVM